MKKSGSQPQHAPYHTENFQNRRSHALSLRQIQQNYSTLPLNTHPLRQSKSAIAKKLSDNLKRKVEMDVHARNAIEQQDNAKIERLRKIQAQIQKINEQNSLKIKQLAEMESTFLKKLERDIRRDREIEEKLLYDYEKVMEEDRKISLTRQVKKLKEKEDWLALAEQQRRLEILAREFEQRQHELARDKSTEPKSKRNKPQEEDQTAKNNNKKVGKKERKRKNAQQLKEIGRQFLEHAKRIQAERLRQNTKLLDVYKKSIDYLPEIKSILKRKGVDLSNPADLAQPIVKPKRRRNSPTKLTK